MEKALKMIAKAQANIKLARELENNKQKTALDIAELSLSIAIDNLLVLQDRIKKLSN